MIEARQQSSTAYPITFKLVLASDGQTPATGKTPTVTLSKNGGSFASASGSVSEIGNGIYQLAGNATDRNTVGPLVLHITATSCVAEDVRVNVVSYDPFARVAADTTYIAGSAVNTSSAQIGVNVVNFGGSAGTFSSGRPEVNTTLIEGVDATNQIAANAGGTSQQITVESTSITVEDR